MSISQPKESYQSWPLQVTVGTPQIYSSVYSGLLESAGHFRLRNGSWSGGGPFLVRKRSLVHQQGLVNDEIRIGPVRQYYSNAGASGTPSFTLPDRSKQAIADYMVNAAGYALTGYNRTKPGQSEADLLVSVKELASDGLPSIPFHGLLGVPLWVVPRHLKVTFKSFQALGSEYLNVIFGWKPFVKDLQKLYELMRTIDKRVNQLVAQNGHAIRRRAVIRDDTVTTFVQDTQRRCYMNVYGSGNPYPVNGTTSWTQCVTNSERVWYNACYRYWIPNPLSWQWQAKARAVLFGALPTPGNLYAAMPWSWMVDWFTSIGTVCQAMSASAVDNLVQLYGYTMRHTLQRVVASSHTMHGGYDDHQGTSYLPHDVTTYSVYTDESKCRTGLFNPFGPDKTAGGFTPYQFSVLSALGLTRLG
jgi:hypothetical protein